MLAPALVALSLAASVRITAPTPSKPVRGMLHRTAPASDVSAAAEVTFFLDDQEIASATNAPYAVQIATEKLAGPHLLYAETRDAAGNLVRSPAVAITIDGTPDTGCASAPGAAGFALIALFGVLTRQKGKESPGCVA